MFNHGLTHRLLNLALSGDAELSEQLSDARAEDVFLRRAHLRSLGYLSLSLPIHDDLRFGAYAAFGTSGRTGSFGFFTA